MREVHPLQWLTRDAEFEAPELCLNKRCQKCLRITSQWGDEGSHNTCYIIMEWHGPESERFGGFLFSTSFLSKSLCKKVRFVGLDQARAKAHTDGSQDEHKGKAKLKLIKIIYFSSPQLLSRLKILRPCPYCLCCPCCPCPYCPWLPRWCPNPGL